MKTVLNALNDKLLTMTANAQKIKDVRATVINEIIALIISEAKASHISFANKRLAQKWVLTKLLADEKINSDPFTKRAVTLAKKLLVDGYVIRKELLTLSQAENLCSVQKSTVNSLMDIDVKEDEGEEYLSEVKEVITNYKHDRANKLILERGLKTKFDTLKGLGLSKAEINLMVTAL
jgi:hypothetical protein